MPRAGVACVFPGIGSEPVEGETASPAERQLAICRESLAMFANWKRSGLAEPLAAAGHSMGIYAALGACGALSESDALHVVAAARDIACEVAGRGKSGMVATIGLDAADVERLLADGAFPTVCRTVTNNPLSFAFSGERGDLERFLPVAVEAGATKAAWIEREVAYHHPRILAEASESLACFLGALDWNRARFPLVSSIDGRRLESPDELLEFTAANLSTPIDWERTVRALAEAGASTLVECGTGTVLTGLGRFIDAPVKYLNHRHLGSPEPA